MEEEIREKKSLKFIWEELGRRSKQLNVGASLKPVIHLLNPCWDILSLSEVGKCQATELG